MALTGLVPLLVIACHDRGGALPAEGAAPSSGPAPSAVASARRPTRHYYLGRTQGRCEVFWVDSEEVSSPTPAPCPADLQSGERIQRVGKTCLREGSDPDRRIPVVCPDHLVALETRDRAPSPHAP